jgi:iron complex transport system permease protein
VRIILLLLCAFTLFLTGYNFQQMLPAGLWWQAITLPQVTDVSQMLFHYSLLPRTTLALLTGAGLALAGCLFQHILRNPLAEPATLGVAAGAQLGLTLATLFLAGAGEAGKQLAALAGAMAVGTIVLGAAWGKRMSPVTLILAAAGTLVQKMTGNPMASPEVLGVSSGAACAIVLLTFLVPGDVSAWQLPAGFTGATLTLLAMLILARTGLAPGRLLLTGVALSTVFATLLTLYLASGDPRSGAVLTWLSGSTWKVTGQQALVSGGMALVLIGFTPLVRRWLTILPLGGEAAQALGVALNRSRISILVLAAGLVAAATLCVGPLSFVGLMAPHMARMLGFRRAVPQLVVAIAIGAGLMLVADWLGRSIIFPFQIPAGLLATLCGAPYFIWLLRKA